MKEKTMKITAYIFEIVLIIILSFLYYLNKPIEIQKVIYIPNGSINKIISQLETQRFDLFKLDSLFLRFLGSPQSGWIDMTKRKMTKADFLYRITTAKSASQTITLIPGETTYIFLKQLSNRLNLNFSKLKKEYVLQTYIKEGAFVPETYNIPLKIDERKIIKILLTQSLKQMKEFSIKTLGYYNKEEWYKYLSIASVIQKESANIKEMPIVSSVIYNRLKKGMKLQMDGTLNYGKYSHVRITAKRIREDKSRYNTYKYKGIPKYPVCNVSFNAINSAIYPMKTDYLYFMKNKKGVHDFSRNYSTHLKNINATK